MYFDTGNVSRNTKKNNLWLCSEVLYFYGASRINFDCVLITDLYLQHQHEKDDN
jgi:hypothetical protein